MTVLAMETVAAFWAIDCSLQAIFVPDDELARAISEGRVQEAEFASSMGTAEISWRRAAGPVRSRDECVVVPPGRLGVNWDDPGDNRDTDRILWQPFREEQHRAVARVVTGPAIEVVLEEAARRLVVLDRSRKKPHVLLQDWLIDGGALDPEQLRKGLRARRGSPHCLIQGIRARWLDRSVPLALAAITESCRGDPVPRMDFLMFAVHAARGA